MGMDFVDLIKTNIDIKSLDPSEITFTFEEHTKVNENYSKNLRELYFRVEIDNNVSQFQGQRYRTKTIKTWLDNNVYDDLHFHKNRRLYDEYFRSLPKNCPKDGFHDDFDANLNLNIPQKKKYSIKEWNLN